MTVSQASSFASEGICLFVDLWEAQPCLGDPDSSQLNYPVRDDESILTWLDLTLAHIFHHAVCMLRVCRKFGPKLASHYKSLENEVKFGLSEPYSVN